MQHEGIPKDTLHFTLNVKRAQSDTGAVPFLVGEESETEEELMARLGMKLEEELAQMDPKQGLDTAMAARWAAEETRREAQQWRQPHGSAAESDDVGDARVVEFEDIEDFVFPIGKLALSCHAVAYFTLGGTCKSKAACKPG